MNALMGEIDWVFGEAMCAQGALHGDECDENRVELIEIKARVVALIERDNAIHGRDRIIIDQFLKERGLKQIS